MIKSCIGELLPDFRTQNEAGFDATRNFEYLKGNSDIPNLLKSVNNYCPVASVHGVFSLGTQISIRFGDVELDIDLKDNKIRKTTVRRAFGSKRDAIKGLEFIGNDMEQVFHNKIVQSHVEYAILHKALLKQYSI